MKKWFTLAFLFIIAIGCINAQNFNPLRQLVQQADLVVEGEVVNRLPKWTRDSSFIYTENHIRIDKRYKGQFIDSMVTLITLGGSVAEVFQLHTHTPSVEKQQKSLFFLSMTKKTAALGNVYELTQAEEGYKRIDAESLNLYVQNGTEKIPYQAFVNQLLLETRAPVLTLGAITAAKPLGDSLQCEILTSSEDLKTIDFTFENVRLSGNNQYIEFDIMAQSNTHGLKFGKAELFITYSDMPFGQYAVQNGVLELQKSDIVADPSYSMVYQDISPTSVRINLTSGSSTTNFYTMTTVKEKLVHGKLKITDFSQVGNIAFDNIDINGRVWFYCFGAYYPFDKVNLGGPIEGLTPDPEDAIGITYTFENVSYSPGTNQYSVEIFAAATATTYFAEGDLEIAFNLEAFVPDQVATSNAVFLPNESFLVDPIYTTTLSDVTPSSIRLLITSPASIDQTDLSSLGTTQVSLGSIYLKVKNCNKPANLHFEEFSMQDKSLHNNGINPFPNEMYVPVVANDAEAARICCSGNPVITALTSPTGLSIPAGTGQILTIEGSNFGLYGVDSRVRFKNGDVQTGEWMEAAPGDFIWDGVNHWTDTKIELVVPSVDKNETWTKPAASGKIQVRSDCGTKTSTQELDIPYSLLNVRTGTFAQGDQLVLKNLNNTGIMFKFSSNVTSSTVRAAFTEALQEWCTKTNINFFLSPSNSTNTSASGTDGTNLVVMEAVSGGVASFVLSTEHQVVCHNLATGETGFVMKDLDLKIDPSNTSLSKQQIKNRILHELGHAHMLNHAINLSGPQDLMYYLEASGTAVIRPDDITGATLVFSNSHQILDGTSCGTPISAGFCGSSSGIASINNAEMLKIYPNPVEESIHVSLLIPNSAPVTFELFDNLGNMLMQNIEPGGQADFEIAMPDVFAPGLYFLRATIEGKAIITSKIVKL